jgi:hypothetical protein
MANVLHWTGVALVLLVGIGAIGLFLRGLSLPPSDPKTRIPGRGDHWET